MIANVQIILTDADNTLWDTNAVFASAQLELLGEVEVATRTKCLEADRLAFVRRFDQALALAHYAHLKYPPSMLVSALALALNGTNPEVAAHAAIRGQAYSSGLDQAAVDNLVGRYFSSLHKIPELLPTVREGLMAARTAGLHVYVMTEGKVEKQRDILSQHSLDGLVAGIYEMAKNKVQFERLRQRFFPAEIVVIGDQPDRDVVPAREANCKAVLVPGPFRPNWHDAEQWKDANYIANTFKDGIDWIISHPN
jgi:putative hydrolase of the HAD superfamily